MEAGVDGDHLVGATRGASKHGQEIVIILRPRLEELNVRVEMACNK